MIDEYLQDHADRQAALLRGPGWYGPNGLTRQAPTPNHTLEACDGCAGKGCEKEDIGLGQWVVHVCEFCAGMGRKWVQQ